MMKVTTLLIAFSCLLLESNGFSLSLCQTRRVLTQSVKARRDDVDNEEVTQSPAQLLGVVALVSALSFGAMPMVSHAANPATLPEMIPSSSVLLSEQVKTLDMSLPSYGAISDAKASVETVKSLSVDPPPQERGSFSSQKKSGMSGSYSSGGDEKGNKKKEAAAAKQKARDAFLEKEDNIGGKRVEVVDMSVPSYDQSTSQEQRSTFSL